MRASSKLERENGNLKSKVDKFEKEGGESNKVLESENKKLS